MPTKAIVLAAGFGDRMRPLATRTPKAMMPFAGAPIIDHTLQTLAEWGVKDVLINLHHAPSKLVEYLRTVKRHDLRISFSFEPEIRETGGAVRQAAWFLDENPFWLVNSDIIFELNPRKLVREFSKSDPLACLWVTSAAGPRTVDVRKGRVKSFLSKTPGSANTVTFCGLHLISPEILKYIPDQVFSSIISAYSSAMKKGRKICAVEDERSYWADVGSPEKLLEAHMELAGSSSQDLRVSKIVRKHVSESRRTLRKHGVASSGFVSVGSIADASRSASVCNAILGHDISLGHRSHTKDCIVGDRTRIRGSVSRAVLPLSDALSEADAASFSNLGWKTSGWTCQAMPPRGSDRKFHRIYKGKQSCILIKYKNVRRENALFTQNLKFLKSLRIPVPSLKLDLPANNLCIVEDLGNISLQSASDSMSASEKARIYSDVIKHTAKLHSGSAAGAANRHLTLDVPFDDALYRWEHELFAKHYLADRLQLDNKVVSAILRELQSVSNKLVKQRRSLIHRDLQSSNIMLVDENPVFIDFQGMRMGSRYYDLASLLLDPYVNISAELRLSLVHLYAEICEIRPETARRNLYLAGTQRLSQAIGAYCRLSRLAGMSHFSRHIPPAIDLLSECLRHTQELPVLSDTLASQS